MKRLRKLASAALLLAATTAAAQLPLATPTPVPPPTPTILEATPVAQGSSISMVLEAEDHAGAIGSVQTLVETGGRSIQVDNHSGNFVQYHFQVPEDDLYDLTIRSAPGDSFELQLLIEGPGFPPGCPTCTAGEWFGMRALHASPEWVETSLELGVLAKGPTYTLTVRILGTGRIDWFKVSN